MGAALDAPRDRFKQKELTAHGLRVLAGRVTTGSDDSLRRSNRTPPTNDWPDTWRTISTTCSRSSATRPLMPPTGVPGTPSARRSSTAKSEAATEPGPEPKCNSS